MKNEGKLIFDEIEDTFYEELALELDEETENVKITLIYLQKCGLIEEISETEFILPQTIECISGETQVAARVRRFRENQKALQSNTDVTKCNTEIEKEIEKEIDLEKEIYIDKKKISGDKPHTTKFIPPLIEQVQEYCKERNNTVNAEKWFDFYSSKGWMIGKNKMKDWKAAIRTWEKNEQQQPTSQPKKSKSFSELARELSE